MKYKELFIIFEGLSLTQIKVIFCVGGSAILTDIYLNYKEYWLISVNLGLYWLY